MKFVYLGAPGAPDITTMFGHTFPLGKAVDVLDERAANKLKGNKFFALDDDERAKIASAAAAHRTPGADALADAIDTLQADIVKKDAQIKDLEIENTKLRARIDQLSVYAEHSEGEYEPVEPDPVDFRDYEDPEDAPGLPELDIDAMSKAGMVAYAESKGWAIDKRKNEDNLREDLRALIQAGDDGDED